MTEDQKTIAEAWSALEAHGFGAEMAVDETGEPNLANGIMCALDCLIRTRNDLLSEVLELRKLRDRAHT